MITHRGGCHCGRVRFEGPQVLAGAAELSAALKARLPGAEWIRPAEPAGLVEADDLTPIYAVPGGKTPQAVRLLPREAVILAAPECLD